MKIKVSDQIAAFLLSKGIDRVFGIVGAGNVHLFESFSRLGVEIISVHHEQAATMAMQTHFKITGKMSACLVTTGAGSTNAVTGVVSAWMDSTPGLVIAGNENSKFTHIENKKRIWGVQGYDSVAMVEKVTKYAARVVDPTLVEGELEKAYAIAVSGRPGPVWLEIPMNVQSMQVEASTAEQKNSENRTPISSSDSRLLQDQARSIVKMLRSAERPLVWLGQGIRLAGAVDLIEPFLAKIHAPALVTWNGLDMLDHRHPQNFGSAGVYGQRCANFVLQNCDFLLTIGTRLAIPQIGYEISEFARGARLVINDIDSIEANKFPERDVMPVVADAGDFMRALLEVIGEENLTFPTNWMERCDTWRKDYPRIGPEHADKDGFINSYPFMEKLSAHLKPDQVIVTDMGTALLSGHQNLLLKKGQRLMTSTGLGEMGYGLPAAIGASFAQDRGEVLCLNCDGGMMMNLQELQTIVHHKLPIKIFIFNNDGYLMIKHTQKALFKGHYSCVDKKTGVSCPNYSAIARAFDIPAYQIRSWNDFDEIVPRVQAADHAVICEVFMHPEQLFAPKLSLSVRSDGVLVSPPLEDLSPLLPRDELRRNMLQGLHPKSEGLGN